MSIFLQLFLMQLSRYYKGMEGKYWSRSSHICKLLDILYLQDYGNIWETHIFQRHGKIVLEMASGQELIMNDNLHVLEILKNLVSSFLSRRTELSFNENEMFVGNGYLNERLFNINVMIVIAPVMNQIKFLLTCLSCSTFGVKFMTC